MSLISNALKNLFNLLGQKTPTNNGVTSSDLVPLLNSSHAPKGDVSITDLASVLGGLRYIAAVGNSSFNELITTGFWWCNNMTDGPTGILANGFVEVLKANTVTAHILQKFYVMNGTAPIDIYTRCLTGDTWSTWVKS